MLRNKGAFTLDADSIVRDLQRDPTVLALIRKKFGPKVFEDEGALNKRALAGIVFSSPKKLRGLERILHSRVRQKIWRTLGSKKGNVAALDIPLLYESKWQDKLDAVIVVSANMTHRLNRLKKKGFLPADAKRRIKAQMKLSEKIKRADFVVNNNGSVRNTKKQVDEIWKRLSTMNLGGN